MAKDLPGAVPRRAAAGYIADPETGFYVPLQTGGQHGVDLVIRSFQERRLAREAGHLRTTVAQAPVLGEILVEIRSQKGQPARTARVELRSVRVDLDGPWRPGGWQPPLLADIYWD